jgi:hypothetical protein
MSQFHSLGSLSDQGVPLDCYKLKLVLGFVEMAGVFSVLFEVIPDIGRDL